MFMKVEATLSRHPNALHEAFYYGTKNNQTIRRAKRRFHSPFGMRHQSKHIAVAIAYAANIGQRTIRISSRIIAAIRRGVTKNNLLVAFKISERRIVAKITSAHMRDRHFQNLSALGGAGKRRANAFHPHIHLLAKKSQASIAKQRTGQPTSLAENLKSIADAENQPAAPRKFLHRFHHRRKTRQCARAQVIAISKPAGQNNRVATRKIFGAVPEEFHRLMEHAADGEISIVIAIRPRKHNHAKFHSGNL